jgi:hypothetical protein
MAVNKVPFVVASTEAESTAALFRQAISSFLNPAGGTAAEKGLAVIAKATPNMEVEVQGSESAASRRGQLWIPGTSLSSQGMYFCSVDSTSPLAIGAASTANPRIDTVIARVKDSFYDAGSTNEFLLEVIAGTPKAGLTKPPKTQAEAEAKGAAAIPASSYVLAYILVPQNATVIKSGEIENVATRAAPDFPWLPVKAYSGNVSAKSGEIAHMDTTGTVTLPIAFPGSIIGVFCAAGVTTIQSSSSENIYGDFVTGHTSITLLQYQHVILLSNPFGNWIIMAGEPKREQEWEARVEHILPPLFNPLELIPNATRPCTVSVNCPGEGQVVIEVDGVEIARLPAGVSNKTIIFPVNAGKVLNISGSASFAIFTSYLPS